MHQDRPSTTSWRVALRRAAHQVMDRPLVLDDSLAVRIVGAEATDQFIAREQNAGFFGQKLSLALQAFVVARSCFAEDLLATAVGRGVRQYVVLGAGLDTFGWRNVHAAAGLRVFEVDHPATQAWKRELLGRAGMAPPGSLTFVPVDFEKQALGEQLSAAGFELAAPAFFSWLGVVPYLAREAFRATAGYVGARAAGTEMVFDYALSPDDLPWHQRAAVASLARRVAAAGEPFRLFLPAAQMHGELTAAGFHRVEELNAAAINRRYFANRSDNLRVGGSVGRLVHAAQ
jgi:methyltransferase (TIGR00027 family)